MLQDELGLACQRHTEITGYTIGAQTHTNPTSTNNFAYLTGRNFGLDGADFRLVFDAVEPKENTADERDEEGPSTREYPPVNGEELLADIGLLTLSVSPDGSWRYRRSIT